MYARVPFLEANLADQNYEMEENISSVSRGAKHVLTVSSSSVAFKKVSLKWLTPSICQEALRVASGKRPNYKS
jgi:hypothetical protein